MLARALEIDTAVETDDIFADADSIAAYAKNAVATLVQYTIINGFEDNTFRGAETCTRAQAARIISNAISVTNAVDISGR